MATLENNKLIDIFNDNYLFKKGFAYAEMNYHTEWNNLMPVVEKIEALLPDDSIITIEHKSCYIPVNSVEFTIEGTGTSKLEAVYNACLEFIKWHNQYIQEQEYFNSQPYGY